MPNAELKRRLRDKFESYIKSKKKRQTQERYMILDRIVDLRTHFDIDHLCKSIGETYHVSRATVYNTVDLLCECGILHRCMIKGGVSYYELTSSRGIHLICTECGTTKNVRDENVFKAIDEARTGKFKVTSSMVNLFGICTKCGRKKK